MCIIITDIFSNFDPASFGQSILSNKLWLIPVIFSSTLLLSVWFYPAQTYILLFNLITNIFKLVKQSYMWNLKTSRNLIIALFYYIVFLNLWGLIPYIFSLSTHLAVTLGISLPLWLALIISSGQNNPYNFVAAIIPSGAPRWLNPFLVLIELIRTNIRPITLAFRLAANMRAGHIVLTLICTYLSNASIAMPTQFLFYLVPGVFYLLFELFITIIQAFIFCLLLTLYANDHQ